MRLTDAVYDGDAPVNEATARALAVNEVLREPLSEHLDDQHRTRLWSLGGGGAAVLLGVVAVLAEAGVAIAGGLVVLGVAVAAGGHAFAGRQEPDVTVTGVEKGYWTGHSIPTEDGVVVYDALGSLDATSFDLERLSDEGAVAAARERLADVGEFPVVMPRDGNVEERVTAALEEVREEIAGAERHTVEAPVVPATGPTADAVEFFADRADADADPVAAAPEVAVDDAREDVEQLAELEQMAAADHGESELESLSETSRRLVSDLSGMQETAIDLLNDHVATAADAFGLVSYHFYCPDCQADDVESRVALDDPETGEWYCETCRSRHETAAVIPRHRIKDDVVNPVWDQLWIEKDDQRREIYENIEDQKQELQEREFEQRHEEIRSATDRIRDLRQRIRDLKTQAQAAEGKVEEIGDLMVKYERLHEERKQQFQQDVQESFREIDAETERILEETRNEDQKQIEAAQKAAEEKAQLIREEERRREVEKFVARQQLANERAAAQMQQRAALHDEEIDLEKRHHRENWMITTRGGTSISDTIDRGKMMKDRFWKQSAYEGGDA